MKGYLYILECSNGEYYTGSTIDLAQRFIEHLNGEGANFTKKNLPVKLRYIEIFRKIEFAFLRENKSRDGVEKRKKP